MSSSTVASTSSLSCSSDKVSEIPEEPHRKKNDICPSKSTVYLANISYSLTNNDLIKLVEHCGRVVCAKIVKDRVTRKSKGFGFVQFLLVEAAEKCVKEFDRSVVFGRTLACSIAKDNGRSEEFIRKRTYPDKRRCYECGDFGHLSYKCTKNALGDRDPPPKKRRKTRKKSLNTTSSTLGNPDGGDCAESQNASETDSSEESDSESERDWDSLSVAIESQREKVEEEEYRISVASGSYETPCISTSEGGATTKRKFVKDGYFSDEENLVDD